MAEKITIDVGDAPAKPTAFEALEKIGRLAVKMQEQDAKFQRLAQHLTIPDQLQGRHRFHIQIYCRIQGRSNNSGRLF